MQTINDILEPAKSFGQVKDAFNVNVDQYFDDLVKRSKVNIEQNQQTCAEIYDTQAQVKKQEKKRTGKKVAKGFSIAGACIGFAAMIFGILGLAVFHWSLAASLPLLIGGLALGVGLTLLICLRLNKVIKSQTALIDELNGIIQQKTDEAWKQMEPLNNLFSWNIPQQLITDTVPLIQLDRSYEPYRYYQMINNYNFNPEHDINESTICVQSGTIKGNPFLFEKTMFTYMAPYTYVGSIVITWTTTERDANGNTHTVTHSQTLTATVTKPKPYYETTTNLIYGNGAAPELQFERSPSKIDASKVSEKKLNKYVKRQAKKLDKKAEKELNTAGGFVKMGNDEFEALFNCSERSNEQQFRLLFTPVGQTNMVNLLKSSPYGDDFEFVKDKMINLIHSAHSQSFEYHSAPWLYTNFDFNKIQQFFKQYTNDYLQSVYFDLAPILSIPLYQQYKSHDYIYNSSGKSNLTFHEVESLCNYFGANKFAHPNTDTNVILKCEFWDKAKEVDNAIIHAYSYKAIPHVTVIQVMGGDGHMHGVPVTWYEYVPLTQSTKVSVVDEYAYETANKGVGIVKGLGFKPVYGQKGLALSIK